MAGLLAALLLVGILGAVQTSTAGAAAASSVAPGASTAHPFSDPTWWPFHDTDNANYRVVMDCAARTPGCPASDEHSKDQAVSLQTRTPDLAGGTGHYVNAPVYAAGAGIVHIGADHTGGCGPNAPSLGNWVWIDHGAGVKSRYGHLSVIDVTDGQYVTPQTVIGKTGNSGERSTCWVQYLNFQITHGTTGVPMTTFKSCVGGAPVVTPSNFKNLNDVPRFNIKDSRTKPLDRGGSGCQPGAPATISKPTNGALTRAGSGALTARWKAPAAHPNAVQVEVRLFHPANNSWSTEVRKLLPVTPRVPTSYTVHGLRNGGKYQVRVSMHNTAGAGWSLPSNWVALSPGIAPAKPGFRGIHGFTSTALLQWNRPVEHGYLVTRYEVGLRRKIGRHYTTWTVHYVRAGIYNYHPTKLHRNSTYQLRVRGRSGAGPTPFLTRTVRTKR